MIDLDLLAKRSFEFENNFYLTASVARISKFATHLELYKRISAIYGEVVEFGVFKGNSFNRWVKFRSLLENVSSRRIIGFDSFGEFPESRFEIDHKKRQEFIDETGGGKSISQEDLTGMLQKLGLERNVELVKGDICQTLPDYVKKHPHLRVALLNIDVDIYEPTKVILETLWPHVVRGGIVILDDYGAMPGANKAIDDFFCEVPGFRVQKLPFSNAISYIEKS